MNSTLSPGTKLGRYTRQCATGNRVIAACQPREATAEFWPQYDRWAAREQRKTHRHGLRSDPRFADLERRVGF